jgi:hypothetical protein
VGVAVGSQWPGMRRALSPMSSRFVAPEMPSLPCSSEARSSLAAGSSQTIEARLSVLGGQLRADPGQASAAVPGEMGRQPLKYASRGITEVPAYRRDNVSQ